MPPTYDRLRSEYAALWATCEIKSQSKGYVLARSRHIIANRSHYEPITASTGIPWFVVGIIHEMECGSNFSQHLHNGDSLKQRTKLVPAGRPIKGEPPFSFEESAIDALTMPGKEYHKITDWSLERCAYIFEKYNGWGYRGKDVPSAYLWSFTNHYKGGKYIADHVWSATAMSSQCGALALLKGIMEVDVNAVVFNDAAPVIPNWGVASEAPPAPQVSTFKAGSTSKSVWTLLLGMFEVATGKITKGIETALDLIPGISGDVDGLMAPIKTLSSVAKINIAGIGTAIVIACIVRAIIRHAKLKAENNTIKGE